MTRIINILGNSGSGKTFTALNLGIALSSKGREVILLDGNIYSPDILNYADIAPEVFLNEFLCGQRKIEDTMIFHQSGMKIIPTIEEEKYDENKHKKINNGLLSLIGKADIVLVDNSPHPHTLHMLHNADEHLFVLHDDYPSIVKAKEKIENLSMKGIHISGTILNKKRTNSDIKHIEAILGKPILTHFSYDEKVIDSISKKLPIFSNCLNSAITKKIKQLADAIDIY